MFGDIMEPTHLLFVLLVALLVLGPKRLPEVGRTLGSGIRDFRQAISGQIADVSDDHHEPGAADSATEQRHQPSAVAEAEPDATPWYEETVDPIDETGLAADEPDATANTPTTEQAPPQPDVPAGEPAQSVTQPNVPATEPAPVVTHPDVPAAEPAPAVSATEPAPAVTQPDVPAAEPEPAVAQSASQTRTEPGA